MRHVITLEHTQALQLGDALCICLVALHVVGIEPLIEETRDLLSEPDWVGRILATFDLSGWLLLALLFWTELILLRDLLEGANLLEQLRQSLRLALKLAQCIHDVVELGLSHILPLDETVGDKVSRVDLSALSSQPSSASRWPRHSPRSIQKLQVMVRAIRVRGVKGERGVPIKGRTDKGAVRVRGLPPAITLTAPAPVAPPYPYSPAREKTYGCVRVRVHPHKGKGGPLTRRSP